MEPSQINPALAPPLLAGAGLACKGGIKQIIEALLFASEKPLTVERIKEVLENDIDTRLIRSVLNELKQDYKDTDRAFGVIEIAGGFQVATYPVFAPWLKKLYRRTREERLTRPSLETLAIVAYKQPVSRIEIEHIRGVDTDGVLKTLLERGLIKILGRKDAPGRPIIYGTTKEFLQYFGLNSLSDLPELEDTKVPLSHNPSPLKGERVG